MTIFIKIIDKEIPADIVFEDDLCLAFRDINPQAPVHIQIIPKRELVNVLDAKKGDEELLGYLLVKAADIARKEGIAEDGFRLVLNNGRQAGQSVDHLHIHILGGRPMAWPPG